jgi:hypothetical protein
MRPERHGESGSERGQVDLAPVRLASGSGSGRSTAFGAEGPGPRYQVCEIGAGQVIDVMILGYHEAVIIAFGCGAIDGAMKLENDRPVIERERSVSIGNIDDTGPTVGSDVKEPASIWPFRQVDHQIKRLASFAKRQLEQIVLVGRDDDLILHRIALLAKEAGPGREESMQAPDRIITVEHVVQFTVKSARAACEGNVFGNM